MKEDFLDFGLNRSKYKRASYTLPSGKWFIFSHTYITEVNQLNVLHRMRKICFIFSPANNNQSFWGKKKKVTSADLWLGIHSQQLKEASSWPERIQFWKITNQVLATEVSPCILIYLFEGASLVAQWLRICLPMQGTRVRALVWEDPTCLGAVRPVSHNYWACASGACAPQQERPR